MISDLVFQRIILVKSTMGLNLWLGNNPYATGTLYLPSGEEMYKAIPKSYGQEQHISEIAQDDILFEEAFSFIKNNPIKTMKLSLTKLYYYWWFPEEHLVTPDAALLMRFMKLPYGVLLFLSIIGLWVSRSRIKSISLFLSFCSFFLSTLFHFHSRSS